MSPLRITPVILTLDEEPNIGRCLSRLGWAERVVVVDSGSTDGTLEICARHPNCEVIYHAFGSHAEQSNFALDQVRTDWVLSLDADYIVPETFPEDLERLRKVDDLAGAWARFKYCVFGRPLHGTLYPERLVLYRKKLAHYIQDGHTQRVQVEGTKALLPHAFDHDDRKSIERWFQNQITYMGLEARKLFAAEKLSLPDRLRLMGWPAPFVVLFWCLVVKRCALSGWPGWYYTAQRVTAELILAVRLMDQRLRPKKGPDLLL